MGGPADNTGRWPLGNLFLQARNQRRMSQEAVAKMAGFSKATYQFMENGRRNDGSPFNPNPDKLIRTGLIFGMSAAETLTHAGLVAEDWTTEEERSSASVDEAYGLLQLCTEPERRSVTRMLREFVGSRGSATLAEPESEQTRDGADSAPSD